VSRLHADLLADSVKNNEFKCLSIDATLRCCMPLMGQGYHRASAAERAQAAFDDDASIRKVLTVRGRTGLRLITNPWRSRPSNMSGIEARPT
jgi:hypothetical protein